MPTARELLNHFDSLAADAQKKLTAPKKPTAQELLAQFDAIAYQNRTLTQREQFAPAIDAAAPQIQADATASNQLPWQLQHPEAQRTLVSTEEEPKNIGVAAIPTEGDFIDKIIAGSPEVGPNVARNMPGNLPGWMAGSRGIQNPDSPFWDLPEEQQKQVWEIMRVQAGRGNQLVRERFGFDYMSQPPVLPHGVIDGMIQGLMKGGFGGSESDFPPVEGENPTASLLANVGGEGLKYYIITQVLGPAGITGVKAETAAGVISAAMRQAQSENPNLSDAALETLLAGLIPATLKDLKKLPKTQISLTEPVSATPAVPTGELTPKVAQAAADALPDTKIKPVTGENAAGLVDDVTRGKSLQPENKAAVTPEAPVSGVQTEPSVPLSDAGKSAQTILKPLSKEPIPDEALAANKPALPKPDDVKPAEPPAVADDITVSQGKAGEAATSTAEAADDRIIGLSKKEADKIRADFGMDKLPEPERRTFETAMSEAKATGKDKNALELADELMRSQRSITDSEHAGLVLKAADLVNDFDTVTDDLAKAVESGDVGASQALKARSDAIIEQLDKLTEATRLGRREAARALSIGRMMVNRDTYALARVTQRAQAVKGTKLTEAESLRIKELVDRNAELETKVAKLEEAWDKSMAEREQEIARRIAEKEATKAKIRAKAAGHLERIKVERQDIKKQIADLGYRVNDITGASVEASYLIGKLAVSYIREGVTKLDEVVKLVLADVPDITERDVWRALNARDPKIQSKAAAETAKRVQSLKTQARLLDEIEDAKTGIFREKRTGAVPSAEIRLLQKRLTQLRAEAYNSGIQPDRLERALKTINELQDQLENNWRAIGKKKPMVPEEVAQAKAKIQQLRSELRVTDELASAEEQLKTGEFVIREKPAPKMESPELERKRIELKIARKDIKQAINDMAPWGVKRTAQEAANTLRAIKATADVSGTFRQGLLPGARRPLLMLDAFNKGNKSIFSRTTAEQIDDQIRQSPNSFLHKRHKLFLADLEGGGPNSHEEAFMARAIEKVPGIGQVIKGSERHMITYLNWIRASRFDEFVERYPNATRLELDAWADWINVASGRGNPRSLGLDTEKMAYVLFAPRFAVSRLQAPLKVAQYWKMPRVRNEIAKDMAAFVGMGGSVLTLAALAGAEVGSDPTESDFGKIRFGNSRVDLWAGFQQPARIVSRIGLLASSRVTDNDEQFQKIVRENDPLELFGRFTAYKLAPSATLSYQLLTGQNIIGDKQGVGETAIRSLVPIILEDIYEAYKLDGPAAAAISGGLNLVGVTTSTFPDSERATRKKIEELKTQGQTLEARKMQRDWNAKNPKNRIKIFE